jgi:hypothetical protein
LTSGSKGDDFEIDVAALEEKYAAERDKRKRGDAGFQRTPSSVEVRNNGPTNPEILETLKKGWQRERMPGGRSRTFRISTCPPEIRAHRARPDLICRPADAVALAPQAAPSVDYCQRDC